MELVIANPLTSTPLLEHVYTGRPSPGSTVLPLYLSHPSPRPSLIYLPNTNPPTLLYSIIQDQLLFVAPCSTDGEPLEVLEFLHRVADVLEDYLGAPLLASKIESNYDVVAQLLSEMVDGGVISCTEPNALRDLVEAPTFMKSLLGGVGLPRYRGGCYTMRHVTDENSTTPSSLTPSATPFSLSSRPQISGRSSPGGTQTSSPVPWRRANVRHTSNELYVDIVETLSVIIAPSGRPLSAIANGTIAFTSKVSGVPDLFLQLGCPGGVANTMALPAFHPCVRLNKWRDRPGDLSFVPPDGRFVLAGYEVDLLGPAALEAFSTATKRGAGPKLNIPATVSILTSLGPTGADFEVRLTLHPRYAGKASSPLPSATGSSFNRGSGIGKGLGAPTFGANVQGTTAAPTIEEVVVHIPLPASVKNVADLRISKGAGEAGYAPGDRSIEWRISTREVSALMAQDRGAGTGCTATLCGTVVGIDESEGGMDGGPVSLPDSTSNTYQYDDEGNSASYQTLEDETTSSPKKTETSDAKRVKLNKVLMPSCATVSFSVKGWLPSGIKVESLQVDAKRSKGLGAGVTPYKGVKYICVSKKGVESRT